MCGPCFSRIPMGRMHVACACWMALTKSGPVSSSQCADSFVCAEAVCPRLVTPQRTTPTAETHRFQFILSILSERIQYSETPHLFPQANGLFEPLNLRTS